MSYRQEPRRRFVAAASRENGPQRTGTEGDGRMILVTGGAGYIGSTVSLALIEAGHSVVVFDDISRGHRDLAFGGALVQGPAHEVGLGVGQVGLLAALHGHGPTLGP